MKNTPSKDWILPYLNNSLTKAEKELFYVWLNENQENKQLYFDTKLVYDAQNSKERAIDINKSWERLLRKRQARRFNISPIVRRSISYAAVATIAVLLSSLYFNFSIGKIAKQSEFSFVSGDGHKADLILLSDGTRVSVGKGTTIKTESNYGKNSRIVYLEGEAFFDVAKQKEKPFIVKLKDQEIEAIGTQFNVMAYASDSISITTLIEGAVKSTIYSSGLVDFLLPNQQLVYNRNAHLAAVASVDTEQYISWMDGYSLFKEQNLSFILNRLSLTYDIDFDIISPSLDDKRFTGTFYSEQSLTDVLDILSLSVPLSYKIEDRRVVISE